MVPANNSKHYKLKVEMTTGFKYEVCCIGTALEGMKKINSGYWTKTLDVSEITKEEYIEWWWKDEKPSSKTPQFAKLEDFFGEEPKRKRRKK